MSYENNERAKTGQAIKTVMDVGMGLFYIAIGCVLVFVRKIGVMEIPGYVAYSLGPIMILGGAFRFHKGFINFLPAKKDNIEEE